MDLTAPEAEIFVTKTTTTSERSNYFFSSLVSSTKQRDCYCHARLAPSRSPHYQPKVRMTDVSAQHTLCC